MILNFHQVGLKDEENITPVLFKYWTKACKRCTKSFFTKHRKATVCDNCNKGYRMFEINLEDYEPVYCCVVTNNVYQVPSRSERGPEDTDSIEKK